MAVSPPKKNPVCHHYLGNVEVTASGSLNWRVSPVLRRTSANRRRPSGKRSGSLAHWKGSRYFLPVASSPRCIKGDSFGIFHWQFPRMVDPPLCWCSNGTKENPHSLGPSWRAPFDACQERGASQSTRGEAGCQMTLRWLAPKTAKPPNKFT